MKVDISWLYSSIDFSQIEHTPMTSSHMEKQNMPTPNLLRPSHDHPCTKGTHILTSNLYIFACFYLCLNFNSDNVLHLKWE